MAQILTLLVPALLAVVLVRSLLLPVGAAVKAAIHSSCGFACLWLLNWAAPVTGVAIPVNGVTVAVAGFLGLPGIGFLALLEVI